MSETTEGVAKANNREKRATQDEKNKATLQNALKSHAITFTSILDEINMSTVLC